MLTFLDFPYDFDISSNVFIDATTQFLEDRGVTDQPDLTFIGCYTQTTLFKKALMYLRSRTSNQGMSAWLNHQKGISRLGTLNGKTIWVTFENRRIPSQGVDLTISFDLDDNGGRNIYFPLIFSYIDFLGKNSSYVRHRISFEMLKQFRSEIGIPLERRKFACAFINNPDPVRLRFIKELEAFGLVDVFGRYSGNYVENKVDLGNNYLLSVCFENDLFPGYVTEKPLEAWLSRSVPIYWGDDAAGLLNSKAVINLSTSNSFKESAREVFELSKDFKRLAEIIREPLIRSDYQKPDLVTFLGKVLA